MLKANEIKVLSDKLNFDIRTTKHCLKDVFSKDSSVIDNKVVAKRDAIEFLRICISSKTKDERNKLFYLSFLPRFTKKDPKQAIVYFIRDYFFSSILEYLDRLEGVKFKQKFDWEELDNTNTFYFSMNEEYMNYIYLNERKSTIVGSLLWQIMASSDLGSQDDIRLGRETKYIINLCSEIAKDVGYQMFLVDTIRHAFVDCEEMGSYRSGLDKTSYGLMSHNRDARIDYIFIFCLCETLKKAGYKAEYIYKMLWLNEIIYMDAKTIRRRYYDIKREMKEKGLDYQTLIKIHNLDHRIYEAERTLESHQGIIN